LHFIYNNLKTSSKIFFAYIICGLYTILPFIKLSNPMIIILCFTFTTAMAFNSLYLYNKRAYSCVATRSVKQIYTLFFLCCLTMMLTSVVYSIFYPGYYNSGYLLLDLCAMLTLFSGLAFINPSREKDIEKGLFFIGGISCFVGLYALFQTDFNIAANVYSRINVFYIQYGLWKTMECWPFLIIFILFRYQSMKFRKSRAIIAFICSLEYFVLSLVFLKRVVFFDIIVLLLVIILANRLSFIRVFRITFFITAGVMVPYLLVSYYFHYDLLKSVLDTLARFDNVTISNFDRFVEFKNLFQQFDLSFLLFGRGFASIHDGPGFGNLHLGLLNYIFKGGFLLFGIMHY
jgi:hypothetical protein